MTLWAVRPSPQLIAAVVVLLFLNGTAGAGVGPQAVFSEPPMVPGELIVRLRSDFVDCAHCLVAQGRGLTRATGRRILDQVRLRYGIQAMEPVFGGVHAAERHRAAQRRFGTAANQGSGASQPAPGPSQIYLVRVDPRTDIATMAAEFRRDPDVISAEPNYLYYAAGGMPAVRDEQRREPPDALADTAGKPATSEHSGLPNDPFLHTSGSWGQDFPDLWGLFQIEAPAAWELSQGEGVIVAVVDSGIDIEHPDLVANVWRNSEEIAGNMIDDDANGFVDDVEGWDFTTCTRRDGGGNCAESKPRGPEVSDPVGHGTHIAGIVAAMGNNGVGIIGVAPKAQVMAVKGLDRSGLGSNCDLAEALVYAAENGARVINASWSGPPSDTIKVAVEYVAKTFDVVVVSSAGNDGVPLERGLHPTNLPEVLAVGSTTHTDEQAPRSNFGGPLDVAAPGGGETEPQGIVRPDRSVLSLLAKDSELGRVCNLQYACDNLERAECLQMIEVCEVAPWVVGTDYARTSGTSLAAPHVSGVAALVRSRHPEFTLQQVRQVLKQGSDDLGEPGWDVYFGYGRLNALQALSFESIPVAEITTPENRAKVSEHDLPFVIRGTATVPGGQLTDWRLLIGLREGGAFAEIARGSSPLSGAILAELSDDLASLQPGRRYRARLEVNGSSGMAIDSKEFLVPNRSFATIPVPDPFDQGGYSISLSADGKRLAVNRSGRPSEEGPSWFDVTGGGEHRIKGAGGALLSRSGRFLYYAASGHAVLENLDTGESSILSFGSLNSTVETVLSVDAERFGFIGRTFADSGQVYLFETLEGRLREVTAPFTGQPHQELAHLVMTPDARCLAFTANIPFDPSASPPGPERSELFLYDDLAGTLRQVTGRQSSQGPSVGRSNISANCQAIAYERGLGFGPINLLDVSSETQTAIIGDRFLDSGTPVGPLLSEDGRRVAFVASGDLDGEVANEDLEPELFLMNLETGKTTQVTDFINTPFSPSEAMMNSDGTVFALTAAGEINGTTVSPPTVRVVPRRRHNLSPTLEAPPEVRVSEGRLVSIVLSATDPDGDPIFFHAERVPSLPRRLRDLARSFLNDRGDGTASLEFTPRFDDAGAYPLRVAAFDDAGGVKVASLLLIVDDAEAEGDANCDEQLSLEDVDALIAALYEPEILTRCPTSDTNADGRLTAADLGGLTEKLSYE